MDYRLRRPSVATRRAQSTLWEVYHPTAENLRFGHIDQLSTGWRAFDWKGRPLDTHRLMNRTQAAELVADNYRKRHP
jgi:hypothetical protein